MTSAKQAPLSDDYSYLVSLIAINQVLLGWLLFQPLALRIVYLIGVVTFSVGLVWAIRYYRLTFFLKPLIIVFAGGLGILLGCILDFGQLGLHLLSSLCVAPVNGFGFGNIIKMLTLAPWTHIGMWFSCSLALFIVDYQRGDSLLRSCRGLKHVFCLMGMLLGMWLIQMLQLNWLSFALSFPAVGSVGFMWLGMSIGMVSSFCVIYRKQIWQNSASPDCRAVLP